MTNLKQELTIHFVGVSFLQKKKKNIQVENEKKILFTFLEISKMEKCLMLLQLIKKKGT